MRPADRVTIELAPAPTAEISELVGALDRALSAEYPPEQRHVLALDAIFQPHIRFFLARLDGAAVGCGGVAQALLARIATEAQSAGRGVLRLETGNRQVAALRLYTQAGFRPCAAFGAYAAMATEAIATSVFMEKRLVRPAS